MQEEWVSVVKWKTSWGKICKSPMNAQTVFQYSVHKSLMSRWSIKDDQVQAIVEAEDDMQRGVSWGQEKTSKVKTKIINQGSQELEGEYTNRVRRYREILMFDCLGETMLHWPTASVLRVYELCSGFDGGTNSMLIVSFCKSCTDRTVLIVPSTIKRVAFAALFCTFFGRQSNIKSSWSPDFLFVNEMQGGRLTFKWFQLGLYQWCERKCPFSSLNC